MDVHAGNVAQASSKKIDIILLLWESNPNKLKPYIFNFDSFTDFVQVEHMGSIKHSIMQL